ncbi:LacI family transcriptional regulator [Iamia sp. SCSIO 61187]|uniref:LacI family DNA-binding transcriptional regulator n=1 Tax=Iamia sp. SCSIO 61187 TaxID=2722752 RepID=UPI001C62E307|nr:LacI family DNA-binding transcriptional regulator [Iamia sp. SCSIO 61187]QYG91965.1 LacI family transcriptional regulator [Iamia sp. SCSIO 61187]
MATIADVAARAGVGAGTVSRVLNGSPKVSEATRARVLDTIAELGYRPNPLAQGLSRGRCRTLGVVVPYFTTPSPIERLRGVAAALDGAQHDLVIFNVETEAHRDDFLGTLTRRDRADGLLLMSFPPPPADLARIVAAGVPVVLVDAVGEGVSSVVVDDVAGGRLATQHLLDRGHERIAFIGGDQDEPLGFTAADDRELGFRQTMADAGVPVDEALVRYGTHAREVAVAIAKDLLRLPDPPTAIFATADVQALGVLEAARSLGVRVPEDLSVIGFDDIELAGYVGLTTVHQPLFESGRVATRLLLEVLSGDAAPTAHVHELPLEVVVRSTTGPRSAGAGPA